MLTFFLSFIVSYVGSIPPGSINLLALQIYLSNNFKSVVYFSLASGLIEFIYSYFAIKGEIFLSRYPYLSQGFSYLTIVVFLVLGIINLLSKPKKISGHSLEISGHIVQKTNIHIIKKGLLVSILNPQVIPFWLIVSHFLEKQGLIRFESIEDTLYFAFGIALGTVASLLSFSIALGRILRQKEIHPHILNRAIGSIFLGLGIFQLGKMIL